MFLVNTMRKLSHTAAKLRLGSLKCHHRAISRRIARSVSLKNYHRQAVGHELNSWRSAFGPRAGLKTCLLQALSVVAVLRLASRWHYYGKEGVRKKHLVTD